MKRLILFNASILTAYGDFRFKFLTDEEAKDLVHKFKNENKEIISAVGHTATAEIMSEVLDFPVEKQRLDFNQKIDDVALIFHLKERAHEGEILDKKEIKEIGYEFGLLTMVHNEW